VAEQSDLVEGALAWVCERVGSGVLGAEPLAGGLGLRRFLRLRLAGPPHRAVLRIDAPEDPAGRPGGTAPEPALEPLRSFLEEAGLPVPRSHGHDPARRLDLLEDCGDETLEDALAKADPAERRVLLGAACDLVPRLQALRDSSGRVPAFGRRLGPELFAYKADLFARESLPLALGREPRGDERRAVSEAFAWIAGRCARAPARLAHRDFQSQNLLVRRGPGRPASLVMIDLQGALLAPPEYDLVCLLRDSYLDLPEEEAAAWRERTRPLLPDAPDPETFELRFALLTLTRKAKDHARFLYAARARGDERWLRFLPATVRALRGAAERVRGVTPALAPLLEWVLRLPQEARSCGR
jgi:aminoglycoside/choline kinase family phosphotransferase